MLYSLLRRRRECELPCPARSQEVFQSKQLAACLLAAHLLLLWLFVEHRWCAAEGGFGGVWRPFLERTQHTSSMKPADSQQGLPANGKGHSAAAQSHAAAPAGPQRMAPLDAAHVLLMLFSGNFVGIVCARTLHYQFYAWYFQSLPLLLWSVQLPSPVRVLLWALIETVWNLYPPTAASSLTLLFCHGVLLAMLLRRPTDPSFFGKMSLEHDE